MFRESTYQKSRWLDTLIARQGFCVFRKDGWVICGSNLVQCGAKTRSSWWFEASLGFKVMDGLHNERFTPQRRYTQRQDRMDSTIMDWILQVSMSHKKKISGIVFWMKGDLFAPTICRVKWFTGIKHLMHSFEGYASI